MNHHYCQACNSTACNGNCARATDKAAIEAQHRHDCAAVDEDANPRRQGGAYCDATREIVVPEICEAVLSQNPKDAVLKAVRRAEVDAFIAGAKWACGAVDYEKEAANQ